jgi:hypothetical protein
MAVEVKEEYISVLVEVHLREPLHLRQSNRARVDSSDASTNAMQSWS